MKKHRMIHFALLLSFLLGIHEGNVALWRAGEPDPIRVFPYRADTLPPQARDALKNGIPFDSIRQLEEMAENYLS